MPWSRGRHPQSAALTASFVIVLMLPCRACGQTASMPTPTTYASSMAAALILKVIFCALSDSSDSTSSVCYAAPSVGPRVGPVGMVAVNNQGLRDIAATPAAPLSATSPNSPVR